MRPIAIEQKYLAQWFLKTSKYSEELLVDLDKLNNWPTKVKLMQSNWIGKSIGAEIKFALSKDPKTDFICKFQTSAFAAFHFTWGLTPK